MRVHRHIDLANGFFPDMHDEHHVITNGRQGVPSCCIYLIYAEPKTRLEVDEDIYELDAEEIQAAEVPALTVE